MHTILVPTDYSATSKNAALYAIQLAEQLKVAKIILYNAYQAPVVTEPTMPVMQMLDIDSLKKISAEGMKYFRSSLQLTSVNVEIEEISEFAILPNAVNDVCERTGAEVIVMGITGANKFEEVLIGSTAISVAKHTTVPVIIIPPHAKSTAISRIMFACDYKKIGETTPVQPIKKILAETSAQLFIVNIRSKHKDDADVAAQDELLKRMFEDYNPEVQHLNSDDFAKSINDFAEANQIDMIITIPRKHGMFDGLFKESHTKQLAFHSHVPLMCIHEEEHNHG